MKQIESENGNHYITEHVNVEFVDPVMFYFNQRKNVHLQIGKKALLLNKEAAKIPEIEIDNFLLKEFLRRWDENYKKMMSLSLPINLSELLQCRKKKNQEQILKDSKFTTDTLLSVIYRAWVDHGFSYSFYMFKRDPKGLDQKQFPDLFHQQEDGAIIKVGKTNMTDRELKSYLKQRSVVIAKFLDKGNVWHCFIHTYNGILGLETGGNPHIHYISGAFGSMWTRNKVLGEIVKGRYNLPAMLHLEFETGFEKSSHVKPPITS